MDESSLDTQSKACPPSSVFFRSALAAPLLLLGLYLAVHLFYFHQLGRFITDAGKEVMVPALLLEGKLLYRDVFWLYGPWAPYFNASMYSLFGIHVDVLLWVAKLLGAGVVLGVYYCLRTIASIRLAFIGGFSVLEFSTTSGYFAWPYSFSNLWATCMALFAVYHLMRWMETARTRHILLSVLCTIVIVLCKFIIALPILVALWGGFLLVRRSGDQSTSPAALRSPVAPLAFTSAVILIFVLVTWFFGRFTDPESYRLQAGAIFHARHLAAAGLYERLMETAFLLNGASAENISAAIALWLCLLPICLGIFTWVYFWRNRPALRPRLLIQTPILLFVAGNLLQMNSSVHAPFVFPASAVLLFASLDQWRTLSAVSLIQRGSTISCGLVLAFCLTLGIGRLAKLPGDEFPVSSSQFHLNWPNRNGVFLQNLAEDIRRRSSPSDKIIIFTTYDYLYLLCERKPALGYFYTWYEPFHEPAAALKVQQALESPEVTVCVTHLIEPFSLAFEPHHRAHPIYQTLRENFEPQMEPLRWAGFVLWKKKSGLKAGTLPRTDNSRLPDR